MEEERQHRQSHAHAHARKNKKEGVVPSDQETMAGLKVFFDSFSQPSRAVLLLLHANNVKFEPRMIKIAKGWYIDTH